MEANPRRLYEFLQAGNQFVIPVIQGKCAWKNGFQTPTRGDR